jgi:predicted acylesterase/phospholipase RssA
MTASKQTMLSAALPPQACTSSSRPTHRQLVRLHDEGVTWEVECVQTQAYDYDPESFKGEKPFCDVVLKGGVTSGVVYPLAIVELAKRYRLKNIGGTSAGAIAAAVAAAAERARDTGGFPRAAALGDFVSRNLLSLFQPHPHLRPLFEIALSTLRETHPRLRILRALWAAARGYRQATLLGLVPASLALVAAWATANPWALVAALLAAPIGSALALGWHLHDVVVHELPRHDFGICPGLRQPRASGPALIDWLADALDDVAGLSASGRPLTFADLWGSSPDEPRINLEILTTNLTAGRPHRLPFRRRYLFREEEFARFFPERIVRWLVDHSQPYAEDASYRWLPANPDLPVIVAVRLSLSFPLLLAAVPLYDPEFCFEGRGSKLQRCWFSDGGVCSNFPIHFFDSIWPRWPTFGFSLEDFEEGRHEHRVLLPPAGTSTGVQNFKRVDSLGSFLQSILHAMQGWRDHLQSALPGYRERVVRVRLRPDEGGLNLHMPPEQIESLSELGAEAGRTLQEFEWPAHRWRRYVISMARFEGTLERMRRTYGTPDAPDALADFLERHAPTPPFAQTTEWRHAAREDAPDLMHTMDRWLDRPRLRDGEIPKPEVDLRITPQV